MQEEGLIYDWNAQGAPISRPVQFFDETLRDGLQSPSVRTPHIEEKLRILHLIESLEIESANIGLPGADAFRTGTGVHAAAVIKALKKGDVELANLIYSGVPSHWFGFEQQIEVGPMCGRSNVVYWLEKHGKIAEEVLIERIFEKAKSSDHILTDEEIEAVLEADAE